MLLRESSNGGGVAPFFSSARDGMLFLRIFLDGRADQTREYLSFKTPKENELLGWETR